MSKFPSISFPPNSIRILNFKNFYSALQVVCTPLGCPRRSVQTMARQKILRGGNAQAAQRMRLVCQISMQIG